ncbi:MAG: hypothetical protein ACT4TC_20300 [Myxococcaceae bacterium]
MRVLLALSLCWISASALAQSPPPPPPVPEEATPAPATPRGASLADGADSARPPQRYSALSAGRGGVWFFVTQAVIGTFTGAMAGAITGARDQDLYPWFLGGGLLFGAVGAVFQYFHPIGGATAGMSALGAGVGVTAGLGLVMALNITLPLPTMLLLAAAMEVGALLPVAFAWNKEDLSPSTLALASSGAVYGLVLTSLAVIYLRGTGNLVDPAVPLLIAPAVGMALGGLLGAFIEPPGWSVFQATAIPIGAAMVLTGYGLILQVPAHKVAATVLVGMAVTGAATVLLTQPWKVAREEQRAVKLPKLIPTATVALPARAGESAAVLPGVMGFL